MLCLLFADTFMGLAEIDQKTEKVLQINGYGNIKRSKIGSLSINGKASITDSEVTYLNVSGSADIKNAQVTTGIVKGFVEISKSKIDELDVKGTKVVIHSSSIKSLIVTSDEKPPVVILKGSSVIHNLEWGGLSGRIEKEKKSIVHKICKKND